MSGVLAIWNDCAPGHEADYELWYMTEHLMDRVTIEGFRSGRRFEGIDQNPRFFTLYEVDSPGVLTSDAYLERVENPSPLTAKMMTEIFKNMTRTVCAREVLKGNNFGSTIVTARTDIPADKLRAFANEVWDPSRHARVELWEAESIRIVSEEENMRGGDDVILRCLSIEVVRSSDLADVVEAVQKAFPSADVGAYSMICGLFEHGLKG